MSQLEAYLPLVLLVVLGYLIFIRPARRRARATAELQAALSTGDEVMLSSGMFATVVDVDAEIARVEVSPGVVIRVHRGAVTRIITDVPAPPRAETRSDDIETEPAAERPEDAGEN